CGVLVLLAFTSHGRLPLLALLLLGELGLIAATVHGMPGARRIGAYAALVGAVAVVAVSALRFALGGQLLLSWSKPGAASLAGSGVAAGLSVGPRRLLQALSGAELAVIPVAFFALGLLQPVELVPVLLCGIFLLGLRASGMKWQAIAVAAAGLLAFFVFTQRI